MERKREEEEEEEEEVLLKINPGNEGGGEGSRNVVITKM